jgi:hypothetical protein
MVAAATLLAACDAGTPHDQATLGPAINVVASRTNIEPDDAYTLDQPIRLGFDRFLDPSTVVRQSILLEDSSENIVSNALIAYDPVTLTVTLRPMAGQAWLTAGRQYRVVVSVPSFEGGSPFGLRAIDGATLAVPATLIFTAGAAGTGTGATTGSSAATTTTFCASILPEFGNACAYAGCHAPQTSTRGFDAAAPLGLDLSSPAGVRATAIGQVADESNTGPRAAVATQVPGAPFGIDMPVIMPGEPGYSWLLYKMLLAVPHSEDAGTAGGSPVSDDERTRLSNFILGQQMPYPTFDDGGAVDQGAQNYAFTETQLEQLSAWIAGGAPIPPQCAN